MYLRFALLLLLSGLCLSLSPDRARANSCADENDFVKEDGGCWRSLGTAEKVALIRGIWTGKKVRSKALEMAGESGSVWFGLDWATAPEDTTIGDIAAYFDKLYETPANRKIKWDNAYLLAALFARDDDENDRLSLLTFLRSNDNLPTEGTLVGVKSANVVVVRSNGKDFDVRLDGVAVAPAVAEKAEGFLKGLMVGGYWGCERSGPTPISLHYGTELFDDQTRLTADMRISSSVRICVAGKPIPLAEGGAFTNVGYYLITHGLAVRDGRVDPKWSEDRKGFSGDAYAEKAREAGLYLYGNGTDPLVEMISGRMPTDTY